MSEIDQLHHAELPTSADLNETPLKIAIIGGGLSGLFTATLLEQAFAKQSDATPNAQITIFEKSRSVGRLATRYRTDDKTGKNWQWSFGAQFFTAKGESFNTFIADGITSDLLQPWLADVVTLTPTDIDEPVKIETKEQWDHKHARYVSMPKMTSWGRELADKLQHTTIQFTTRVAPLAQYGRLQTNTQTELFDDNGESLGHFDWVICTAPNAQAIELMADSGFAECAKIMQPKMLACYTLMLGWDATQSLPDALAQQALPKWDVAYIQDSILDRLFIEHQKPNHDQLLPSVTIHASNEWSEQHVDEEIDTIKAQLLAAAQQALHWNMQTAPSQVDCHRWRYASTVIDDKKPLGVLLDIDRQWIVSGDWCDRGNIESAYQMAEEVVAAIVHKH